MTDIFTDEVWESPHLDKAIRYHQGQHDIEEATNEINEAEGEFQEQMEPVNRHIEVLHDMKKRIVETGMTRGIADRIGDITGNTDVFAERGIALESFSMYPSRTNIDVSLEAIDEGHKNIAMGVGAGILIAVILKVLHAIWKFFRKSKSSSSTVTEEQKKVVEAQKKVEEQKKAVEEIVDEISSTNSELHDAKEKLKKLDELDAEKMDAVWTGLLEGLYHKSDILDKTKKIYNNFNDWQKKFKACRDAVRQMNLQFPSWVKRDGGAEEAELDKMLKGATDGQPPVTMMGNIKETKDEIAEMLSVAGSKPKQPLTSDLLTDIAKTIVNSGDRSFFFSELAGIAHFEQSDLSNDAFVKGVEDTLNNLGRNVAEAKKDSNNITKEQAEKIENILKLFKENVGLYSQYCLFYNALIKQSEVFMKAMRTQAKNQSKLIYSIFKKGVWMKLTKEEKDKLLSSSNKKVQSMAQAVRDTQSEDGGEDG